MLFNGVSVAQTAVSSLSQLESGTKFRMPRYFLLDRVVNVREAQNVLAICDCHVDAWWRVALNEDMAKRST